MAKTPVTMQVKDYQDREVLMVTYDFEQATDREGQMTGIARGGKIGSSDISSDRIISRHRRKPPFCCIFV